MNKMKLNTCLLLMLGLGFGEIACSLKQHEPGTLHIRVKKFLAQEIAKRKSILPVNWCSKVKCYSEKYGKLSADLLFFPPFRRLFLKSDAVPFKFATAVPGVSPALGLWLIGSNDYAEYVKNRSKLVEFKYKVECLQKYWKSQRKNESYNYVSERIEWYLEEGYLQAHEALMNGLCEKLQKNML